MSAWMCSDRHLFELAAFYVEKCQQYEREKLSFQDAARILYDENVKSLQYRYDDSEDDFDMFNPPIAYKRTIDNHIVLFKQIMCYEYQACEDPGWENSRAKKMCDTMQYWVIASHPDYDVAPWGID